MCLAQGTFTNRPGRARCQTPGPWPCARCPRCTCSRNTANRQPGQAGGERGGGEGVGCPNCVSHLGVALQKREPQFGNKRKGREGDNKQMRGMRENPLQGLRTRQSPVQSSRPPPATHFLHTLGDRGPGRAGACHSGRAGAQGPLFPAGVRAEREGAGRKAARLLGWCGRPGHVKSTPARGPEATPAPRPPVTCEVQVLYVAPLYPRHQLWKAWMLYFTYRDLGFQPFAQPRSRTALKPLKPSFARPPPDELVLNDQVSRGNMSGGQGEPYITDKETSCTHIGGGSSAFLQTTRQMNGLRAGTWVLMHL